MKETTPLGHRATTREQHTETAQKWYNTACEIHGRTQRGEMTRKIQSKVPGSNLAHGVSGRALTQQRIIITTTPTYFDEED